MDAKTLETKKSEKGLFPELYMDASSLALESLMTIDGADVYKVKVTKGETVSYGIMLPNTMKVATGPQVLSFETTEVKINEGVTDADFN